MPGVTARSAAKNMSRGKRASLAKNTRRCDQAVTNGLDYCTYGKVVKALGNKMFTIVNTDKEEHLSHIRGKMARIAVDDIVLLNIRDYETRTKFGGEVYDIMAVFAPKDIHKLRKQGEIPSWMTAKGGELGEEDELRDLFDYEEAEESGDEEEAHSKKNKKNHRAGGKIATIAEVDDDSDVDVDAI
jgi:translation initiation factor IF-1